MEERQPACKALFTAGNTCARLLVWYIELEVVCHARRAALLAATLCSVQVLLYACTKNMVPSLLCIYRACSTILYTMNALLQKGDL